MKQIVVVSGKGGTGKTILTASFAALAKNKVMVDCDVDAADLHLLLHPEIKEKFEFKGMPKAVINQKKCTGCGECAKVCRYDAIINIDARYKIQDAGYKNSKLNSNFYVEPISCEGCRVCMYTCPIEAISMKDNIAGEWYISETKYGQMVHAKLGIAEENSGKLVARIRQEARTIAEKENCDYIIIDGPPGIGCPVIASITGVDIVLIVTEPTLSGLHDMERVIELTKHFRLKIYVIINKCNINPEMTTKIEEYCKKNGIKLIGKIIYDTVITEAMVHRMSVVEFSKNSQVAQQIKRAWEVIQNETSPLSSPLNGED